MSDTQDFSKSNLERCSYRYLQQVAKSMSLPSNVKKVQMIELIVARKTSPEAEVNRMVRRIKQQRKHQGQCKKRRQQTHITTIQADSSDSEAPSPPITATPKRPIIVRCTPDVRQAIIRSQTVHPSVEDERAIAKPVSSDRVLRSFSIKTDNPVNFQATETQEAPQLSMHIVRKYKPNILSSSKDRQMVPVSQMPAMLIKRPRLLSGIYPMNKDLNFHLQSVGIRNSEGKISKINAFIHKPRTEDKSQQTTLTDFKMNMEVAMQDLLNSSFETQHMQSLNYPNTSGVPESISDIQDSTSSVYYHKKIRAEQVRERRGSAAAARAPLPRIGDAFGQFPMAAADVTQPIYVQVSEESERIFNYPSFARHTSLLETVYNFKNQFLTTQPLLQLATTCNTHCVYSAPTVATAAPYKPATASSTEPYKSYEEKDSQYPNYNTDSSQMTDCFRFSDQGYDFRCNEEQHTSGSSLATTQSQDLGANVTISDMVEDALELISQDGDYMERMGMDVKMQCILCNWAGPKIILEYHIRKEHLDQIDKQEKRDWNITYSLGSLVRQELWSCRVIEHDGILYVLSVKHEHPDCFMASLSSLSTDPNDPYPTTGTMTVFNKVTGEPHTWEGEIPEISPKLPYDNEAHLKMDLSSLNLLPNSANLKFVNGELVRQSPSKVVFGQDLNDTSRVLDSTARYVKFVRKLRALEEEERKGKETKLKELKDKQYSDFFIRCDRRALINNVARRVDLCLASYQADLQKKRERLIELLAREEEADIRKFVEQAQAGAEAVWRDKQARLAELLAARQKEHQDKYKDTPLSKCVHVLPCIVKLRAKECQEVQLYQIKEKAARRAAEKEFDKMWNAVAMKESEALAARMEYDVIERVRRDTECLKYSEQQLAQREKDRERERERLKQEALYFRQLWDADIKKEEEAERRRSEQRLETARERNEMIRERCETVARHAAEAKLISDTWDALAGQGLADQNAKEELRRRKEVSRERKETVARHEAEAKLISDTWDALAGQGLADQNAKEELRRRKEVSRERKETVARHEAEAKLISDPWDALAGQGLADQNAKEELRRRKEVSRERKETIARHEAEAKLISDTWDALAGQGLADQNAKEELRRRKEVSRERKETVARHEAEAKLISDTWDALAGQGLADQNAKEELRRRKEVSRERKETVARHEAEAKLISDPWDALAGQGLADQNAKEELRRRKEVSRERKETVARHEAEAKLISDTWDALAGQGLADQNAKEELRRRKEVSRERKETVARHEAEAKLINDTWDALAGQGLADQNAKEELRRRKEVSRERKETVARHEAEAKLISDTWDALAGQGLADQNAKEELRRRKEVSRERKETVARHEAEAKLISDTWDALAGQGLADQNAKEELRRRKEVSRERKETVARHEAEAKLISDTWDALAGQGLADQNAKEELRRRKERELDECNRKLIELREAMAADAASGDAAVSEVAKAQQEVVDKKRCEYLSWSQKTNREVRKAMVDQIKDRQDAKVQLKQRLAEQDEYHRQLFGQLQQLAQHKDVTDAQARKQHQNNLLQQIEYNKVLKERALQEEKDQIRKCQLATEQYQQEASRMLCRPFFSDELHPFMKPLARGLAMKPKCPCSRPDYCAVCKDQDSK